MTVWDEFKSVFAEYRIRLLNGILGALLLFQFAAFVSVASQNIDPRSLLGGRDADAGHVVGTATRTRWYKDNGETAYGALFYRVSHTFGQLIERPFVNDSSAYENLERSHHLTVMVLSLLCVYAIAFLLLNCVTESVAFRLGGTLLMVSAFLRDPAWAMFVVRAHPDMFFGLTVLVAMIATQKYLEERDSRLRFRLAALAWGVCGMAKLAFVMFLPGLLFLFVPPVKRENLVKAFKFYLWALAGFVLPGVPQSLNFPRYIRFLLDQSQYGMPATAASVWRWADLFVHQIWFPALILLLVALFATSIKRLWSWRLLPLVIVPLLVLLRQNSEIRDDYYLIPVVSAALFCLAIAISGRFRLKVNPAFALPIFLAILFGAGAVPGTMEASLLPTLKCREEAHKVYSELTKLAREGQRILVDPYYPYDLHQSGDKITSGWANTLASVDETKATVLGFNKEYNSRFLVEGEPAHFVQVDAPNWRDVRSFYQIFQKGEETVDPKGRKWRRTLTTECGWSLWQAAP